MCCARYATPACFDAPWPRAPRKPSLCRCVVAAWLCVVHYFDVAVSCCVALPLLALCWCIAFGVTHVLLRVGCAWLCARQPAWPLPRLSAHRRLLMPVRMLSVRWGIGGVSCSQPSLVPVQPVGTPQSPMRASTWTTAAWMTSTTRTSCPSATHTASAPSRTPMLAVACCRRHS